MSVDWFYVLRFFFLFFVGYILIFRGMKCSLTGQLEIHYSIYVIQLLNDEFKMITGRTDFSDQPV